MEFGYGTNVKVEKSTYDTGFWVFVRNSKHGPVKGVLHLDPEQARDLIRGLEQFIDETY